MSESMKMLSATTNRIATPYSCARRNMALTNATMINDAVIIAHSVA